MLALLGEAGIGKTHLAATFARDTRTFGTRVVWSQADQTRRDQLYDVWRQAFIGLLDLTESRLKLPPAELLAYLQETLAEGAFRSDNRLPLFGDLIGVPLPENETTTAFEPLIRRESLFALLLAILQAYTHKPLLLVIDDAHLLDEASHAFLLRVMQSMRNWSLFVLLVRRPPEDDVPAWRLLTEQPMMQTMDVTPLDGRAIASLFRLQLAAPPTPLLTALLQRQTHGNPFYLESLVETLRDDNQIVFDADEGQWQVAATVLERLRQADCVRLTDGGWVLDANADLAALRLKLPNSIHRSVLTRIDRLPEQTKLILKLASVIGQQFAPNLLQAAHPQAISAETIQASLTRLRDRNLIVALDGNRYQFRHHATQEVAYDTLLFTQRQQLHQLVLTALHESDPDNTIAVARHAFAAQAWRQALPALRQLGSQAQRLYANLQTVALYQQVLACLDALGETDGAYEVHLALGESLNQLGRYDDALVHLTTARELAEVDSLPQFVARACRFTARTYELQGDYPTAIAWLEQGLAADQNESRESAELFLLAGLIEMYRGNFDDSQNLCDSSIVMAEHFDTPSVLGRAYTLAGILALSRGQIEDGIAQSERALSTYRKCSDRRGEALALNQLANALADSGSWRNADQRYREARAIFVETGDVYNRLLVDNNIGRIAQDQNRLDDALVAYDAALESLDEIGGAAYAKGAILLNRGATQVLNQKLAAARSDLQESRDLFESSDVRAFMPELVRIEALLALGHNDLATASSKASESLALAKELEMRSEEGHALRVSGQVMIAAGDLASAESCLQQSLAILQENEDIFGVAETQQQLAQLYQLSGDPEQVNRYSTGALQRYAQLGVERLMIIDN